VKVREIIRELNEAGWVQIRPKRSHRQFQHANKTGTLTVPGALGKDFPSRPSRALCNGQDLRGSAGERIRVVIEDAGPNRCAYVPDLPGCVSAGLTVEEVTANIHEAIEMHMEAMIEQRETVP
jgi:predicted RNase H-like HicB family nuclease/predicted RNA binding protein YcfA (HicA-like mRNA interferase family)